MLNHLEQDSVFQQARTVLLYYSLKDEVQTQEFVEKWSKHKKILLPVVAGDELELRVFTGKQDLHTGSYGIEEPAGKLFTAYSTIDLAIIPGVSFDMYGNRLGRGKGYYDRLLPELKAYRMGICFHFQVSEEVPTEKCDARMHCVYTEKGRLTER